MSPAERAPIPSRAVFAPGQDAVLLGFFRRGGSDGVALEGVSVEGAAAIATYRRRTDGAPRRVVLLPRTRPAPDGPSRDVGPLRVVLETTSADAHDGALLDALAAHGASVAESLRFQIRGAADGLDLELLALLAGVKPAVRSSLRTTEADERVAYLRSLGLYVETSQAVLPMHGARWVLVHAAPDPSRVRALRALERRQPHTERRELAPIQRAIGALLGYPRCCVESFTQRVARRRRAALVPFRTLRDDTYEAAREAFVPAPCGRLNGLLPGERRQLVSFEPCSYACDAARREADALASLLASRDPGALTELDRALARPIAITRDGARALVELDREGTRARIVAARAVSRLVDAAPDERIAARAQALVGCHVGPDGRVEERRADGALVLDFRLPVGSP